MSKNSSKSTSTPIGIYNQNIKTLKEILDIIEKGYYITNNGDKVEDSKQLANELKDKFNKISNLTEFLRQEVSVGVFRRKKPVVLVLASKLEKFQVPYLKTATELKKLDKEENEALEKLRREQEDLDRVVEEKNGQLSNKNSIAPTKEYVDRTLNLLTKISKLSKRLNMFSYFPNEIMDNILLAAQDYKQNQFVENFLSAKDISDKLTAGGSLLAEKVLNVPEPNNWLNFASRTEAHNLFLNNVKSLIELLKPPKTDQASIEQLEKTLKALNEKLKKGRVSGSQLMLNNLQKSLKEGSKPSDFNKNALTYIFESINEITKKPNPNLEKKFFETLFKNLDKDTTQELFDKALEENATGLVDHMLEHIEIKTLIDKNKINSLLRFCSNLKTDQKDITANKIFNEVKVWLESENIFPAVCHAALENKDFLRYLNSEEIQSNSKVYENIYNKMTNNLKITIDINQPNLKIDDAQKKALVKDFINEELTRPLQHSQLSPKKWAVFYKKPSVNRPKETSLKERFKDFIITNYPNKQKEQAKKNFKKPPTTFTQRAQDNNGRNRSRTI